MPLSSSSVTVALIGLYITDFQCLFYHAYRLLLVTQSRKAAKCHIVGPIEATEILRMLHAFGPVRLWFEVLSNLTAPWFVLLLRLLVLHQSMIEHVHFMSLFCLLRFHFLDKLDQLICSCLTSFIAFLRIIKWLRADILIVVVFLHDSLSTNSQISARVNLYPLVPIFLSCHELLPRSASMCTRLGLLPPPIHLVGWHGTGGLERIWAVNCSAFGSLGRVQSSHSYRLGCIDLVVYALCSRLNIVTAIRAKIFRCV